MDKELCCVCKGKRNPTALIFYRHPVCQAHYDQHCDGFIDLKKVLNIVQEGEVNKLVVKHIPIRKQTNLFNFPTFEIKN